jgi:hypothetical protein
MFFPFQISPMREKFPTNERKALGEEGIKNEN